MVTITSTYAGKLRCTSTHGPSDCTVSTDAPKDNCGLGESFSPTDLVATALLSCTMTIMGIIADREGIDLKGMTGTVTKGMEAEPTRRIASLPIEITIPVALSDTQKQKLENAARTCPVAESIRSGIEAPITFIYC